MSAPYPERRKEIFGLALELPPDSREQFVSGECEGDSLLFQAVMEMIRKHDDLPDLFEKGAPLGRGAESVSEMQPATEEFRGDSRFQLIQQLGAGGFGSVYEAFDRENHAVVALKTLKRADAARLRMFKQEFRAVAELAHPNLVQLYELIDDGRHWFLTMELVRGTDFVSYVRGASEGTGEGCYDRLRSVLRQLIEAVRYLHERGMLHRDIKPSNIRVTSEGELKLLDFGLVRYLQPLESGGQTETVAGTAAYMAPDRSPREASDWYSVGAVLYEALTGRPPFQGGFLEVLMTRETARPPRELATGIPDDLNELCTRLLELDSGERLNGAGALAMLRATAIPEAIDTAQREPLFVGRTSDLAELQDAFEEVRGGEPVCVHVKGPSGMGKSALCRQFLANVRKQGAVTLSGRCYESESVPFKAIDPIVDALGDYLKSLRADAAAFLPRERPLQALAHLFPTLRRVEAIGRTAAPSFQDADPRDLQRRAIAALREILARVAEKRACVIHIDDFQWGDLDSVDCLTSILAAPDPPPVLFLFSYRSENASSPHIERLLPKDVPLAQVVMVEVGPLKDAESCELVRRLLGEESAPAQQSIDRETGGMPLFIHELAQHARSGLRSQRAAGLSLQEMIQDRIGALPAAARRMMELVSLAGRPIHVEVARQAGGLEDGERAARKVLVAQNLIRHKSADEVEPYHDKIREAAVAGLTAEARRNGFEALGVAMEERGSADPEIVYQYFLEAGNLPKAERWIETAAERATRALAFDLAVRLREKQLEMRAMDAAERPLLLERLAEVLALAGRGLEAAHTYEAATQGANPAKSRELSRKAGEQYIRSGDFKKGRALLCGLLERVGFYLPAQRWHAMLLWPVWRVALGLRGLRSASTVRAASAEEEERLDICRVASLAMALQDPIRAAELQCRHLLHSLRLGEPYRIANSLAMEAGYRAARRGARSYPKMNELLAQIEQLAVQSHHPNGGTLALSVRTKVAWLAGRWEESAKAGEEVNRMATEEFTRVAWEVYPSSIFWICSLACLGRWREVIERLPGLEADGPARGDLLEMTNLPVSTFAYVRWLLADKPGKAAEELERTAARLSEPGFIPHRFGICYGFTEVALYEGDVERARQAVTDGWEQLEAAMALRLEPVRILMLYLRARVACAAAASAKSEDARRRFLADALGDARRIRRQRTVWGNAIADLMEAGIRAEQHRTADAKRLLESSEEGSLRAGMQHLAAAARYRKAQLSAGDTRREAQRQAAIWLDSQRAQNPERLVEMLSPGNWQDLE